MDTTRQQLERLIDREEIAPADYQRAATSLGLYPSMPRWRRFLDQLFLWLSALALGFALLFFIAYNWTAMGRLGRFVLVELALMIALGVYLWRGGRDGQEGCSPVAQAALFAAALSVGGLLALFGQTYQTGADPWQLFFTWSLMILPWALIARLPALWLLVIGLWNLAALLYHQTFGGVWLLTGEEGLARVLFLTNGLALLVWEFASHTRPWLGTLWPQRLLGTGMGIAVTWLALLDITLSDGVSIGGNLLEYCVVLGLVYWVYRYLKPDLFMLAGGCLSTILVIDAIVLYHTLGSAYAEGFLLVGILTIGLTTAAVRWLLKLHRLISHDPNH
ncbi:DUF2157 domain-containing protein [Marinimicrobium agarilyticum]|uniref:DUF2157 domain-containing protein n=1 Tax=Marinimicrobium agarilyticum TaxID=306546 RepID=UPI0003FF0D6A|nr:DUF2157 domain-containing protein [Marinimicrobium agarilyticum]